MGLPKPDQTFDRYPHELSGGMRQRVAIAMALLFEPKVIVADEATSALDVTLEAQILELLLRLRDDHGTSMMFISHDLGVVSQLCDRVAVMYAGRVVEEVDGEAVLAKPRHPYTQALDAVRAEPAKPRAAAVCHRGAGALGSRADPGLWVRAALHLREAGVRRDGAGAVCGRVGRGALFRLCTRLSAKWATKPSLDDWRLRAMPAPPQPGGAPVVPPADPDEPLLELDQLAVHFGGSRRFVRAPKPPVRAVDGVTLTLRRSRVLGIVGESGSGKTTLGEAVVKLLEPTGGTIRFAGRDVTRMTAAEAKAFRRRGQMIFQNAYASLSPRMQIGSLVTEPYVIHKLPPAQRRSAEELLDAVGLPATLTSAYPGQVSGGQARRVGIARALALEPDLVVADEPTAGLDASSAAATVNLIADLRERMGLTVVLISHNLSLVATSADEVAVMYLGRVVEHGDTKDVIAQPAHPYTKALLAVAPDPERSSRTVRRQLLLPGEIPSPDAPPAGCHFHPRLQLQPGHLSPRRSRARAGRGRRRQRRPTRPRAISRTVCRPAHNSRQKPSRPERAALRMPQLTGLAGGSAEHVDWWPGVGIHLDVDERRHVRTERLVEGVDEVLCSRDVDALAAEAPRDRAVVHVEKVGGSVVSVEVPVVVTRPCE